MSMDLGMRNTLLYDSMHCMTAVLLEMSDEPFFCSRHVPLAAGSIFIITPTK